MKKKHIVVALILIAFNLNSCKHKKKINCIGKDRWDIKTLTDKDEANVNYTPINTTLSYLINLPVTTNLEDNTPRFGFEFFTFKVKCKIREFKISDDGDYHLVLMDVSDKNITMVGEIPNKSCASVSLSKYINQFVQARKDFQNSLLSTSQVDTITYTITGVAFFDKVHGQLGAAPSAIELHPILSITN